MIENIENFFHMFKLCMNRNFKTRFLFAKVFLPGCAFHIIRTMKMESETIELLLLLHFSLTGIYCTLNPLKSNTPCMIALLLLPPGMGGKKVFRKTNVGVGRRT